MRIIEGGVWIGGYTILHSRLLPSALVLAVLLSWAGPGKYPIKNFAPSEYGAGIQNIDFAQNRDLSLFVANNLGVLAFNGTNWEKHALNTGKKQRSLAFDEKSNRLYTGSQGDFGYFEVNWRYVSLFGKIPKAFQDFDEVWSVFLFESRVYFCTFQGIYVFDGDTISVIRLAGGFNRSFRSENRLFTQSSTGHVFEIKDNRLDSVSLSSQRNQVVAGATRIEEGGYLFFCNSGALAFLNSTNASKSFEKLESALAGKFINHVLPIADGRWVISTQRAGLFIYTPSTHHIENISAADGLLSNACLKTYQDNSGNLWVGMQSGIATIDINSPLGLVNQNIGLEGSGYEAFDMQEGTYYTTSNGIYFLPKNESNSKFLVGTEGPAYGMQLIKNKLYAGHHTGLFLLEGGKALRRAVCDGLWQIKPLQTNPSYVIGGTYSGLYLFRFDKGGVLTPAQKIKSFHESSRFFEEDRKGRIWVGQYYKGLYLLTLNDSLTQATVKKISDDEALPIQRYIFLSRIDDQLYVNTAKGIFKIDQEADKIITEETFTKVVGKDWVYQLVQDKQKNVHVYTENQVGLFKQISSGNYVYVTSSLFQLRQSFNNDLLHVSKNVANGIFFNANEGFIHYNPDLEEQVSTTKLPVTSKVFSLADDSVLYLRMPFEARPNEVSAISISEGTKVLQFVVESFKYKDVGHQQFRYYLSGFDESYSDWTHTNTKEYTNLKAGTYSFEIQTFNSRGEIISGQPLLIEVTPLFYKTPAARAVYFILIVLCLYYIYRLQRQYYRRKQQRLELIRQKELALKHDELKELKEEQIKRELSHVNNLLAASTMNLVVKNEFMETIKEEIRQAKATDKVEDKQRALERIIKEIDTSLHLQEDWKQFEHHFDKVHGDFLKRLTTEFADLTPGEQKLCTFLRLNMDTKEIANLMSISLRGVEIARYRLRKKFKLETHQNLSKFILEY